MPVDTIEQLLVQPNIWRGRSDAYRAPAIATGHPVLDAELPGAGWPRGAVIEMLHDRHGCGELSLLLPTLAALSQPRDIAWIDPPFCPYAPALAQAGLCLAHMIVVQTTARRDGLWAAEQILRSGVCAAMLLWPARIDDRDLRRLQLAAAVGDGLGIVFRGRDDARAFSPAALRLSIEPRLGTTGLRVLKSRGGRVSCRFGLQRTLSQRLVVSRVTRGL